MREQIENGNKGGMYRIWLYWMVYWQNWGKSSSSKMSRERIESRFQEEKFSAAVKKRDG